MSGSGRTTIAAIISPRQSGSTILTYLLGAHPQIATVGEVRLPPANDMCSCGEDYAQCAFWRRVTAGMERAGFAFDIYDSDLDFLPRGRLGFILRTAVRGPVLETIRRAGIASIPCARNEMDRLLRRNEAFVDVVTQLKGCNTFLDSTKRASRALHLRRSAHLTVKVIHLIRDGRSNSWSAMRHGVCTAEHAASHWLQNHQEAERAKRYFPGEDWIDIRHEDVCADPRGILERLHDFLGVNRVPVDEFRRDQHILGNSRTRTASGSEIRLDDRWVGDLTLNERITIDGIVGPLNRRYGYA